MKMMWVSTHLLLFSIYFVMVSTRPTALEDIFNEYLKNVKLHNSEMQTQIVKRRVDDNNQDVDTKNVPLQSIIGDLEHNFFKTATNVSSIIHQSSELTITNPTDNEKHPLHKRKTTKEDEVDHKLQEDKIVSIEKTTTDGSIQTTSDQIITKEVGPTQIQIKHISIQPQHGNLSILPTFKLQHRKPILTMIKDSNFESTEATTNDPTTTQFALPQESTEKKSNEHIEKVKEKENILDNMNTQTEVSHNSNNPVTEDPVARTTTTTVPTTTATTKKSVAELKETEAELKEKVAEIEAEPVILSARV